MRKIFFVSLAILGLFIGACNNKNASPETTKPEEATDYTKVEKPIFNMDSAYSFVEKQLAFGARVPGTKAHELCAEYLAQTLNLYADTVIVQTFKSKIFDGTLMTGKNIIASFDKGKEKRVLLAAHWDSRMFADHDPDVANRNKSVMGANDGASGVGILLEIARLLKTQKPNIGIDIILFDLEDQGAPNDRESVLPNYEDWCIGAQYWAKNKHIPFYQAQYGILLDMVGYKEPRFMKEDVSMQYAPFVMNKVWTIANQLGYSSTFIDRVSPGIIDDHLFINKYAEIPMIDIVQTDLAGGFFPHWHTTTDDINVISKNTLNMVGDVVVTTIFSE